MLDSKGQIRIIEAFLAVSVMFSALLFTAPMPYSPPDLDRQSNLKKLGMQVLSSLDHYGTLGRLIEDENWTTIRQTLDLALPQGVFYNLTIYDENVLKINSREISNTNQLGQEAVMVQYLCVTQGSVIRFYTVRLLLGWPN